MARVTGIGGVFLKARDPKALAAWYAQHLGIEIADYGGATLLWSDEFPPAPAKPRGCSSPTPSNISATPRSAP